MFEEVSHSLMCPDICSIIHEAEIAELGWAEQVSCSPSVFSAVDGRDNTRKRGTSL